MERMVWEVLRREDEGGEGSRDAMEEVRGVERGDVG